MRLTDEEVDAIRKAAVAAFGADAVVRLFGSRTDDDRRGGDIDLHVEVASTVDEWTARSRFEECLFARIDEQKVDVVLKRRGDPPRGIDLIAQRDGILI